MKKNEKFKIIIIKPQKYIFHLYIIITIFLCAFKLSLECYESCEECGYTEGTSEHHQCETCKSGYYFISLADHEDNCYTKEETVPFGSFYVNQITNTLEECHEVCQTCLDGFTPTEINNRCYTCKPGYYKRDSIGSLNCFSPKDIPNNYYLDTSKSEQIFSPCYERCHTCSQAGNDNEHNCDSCKVGTSLDTQYYKLDSEETGNCYLYSEMIEKYNNYEIPFRSELNQMATRKINERNNVASPDLADYTYIYELIARKCYKNCKTCSRYGDEDNMNCITCITNYYFYQNNCYEKCPKPNTYQLKESIQCKELVEGYKIVTDYKTSNDIVDFLLYHGLGEFDFEKDLITAHKIYGQIYSWKNKGTNDELADRIKLSKISISDSCFEKIIAHYDLIPDIKEDIIIIKLDRNYTDSRSRYKSSVNQVDFYLFYPYYDYDIISGEKILNGTYSEISISICNNEDEIKIIKPLINLDERTTGVHLSKANKIHKEYPMYDMYLAQNIFFSDICSTFKSEENYDVELADRRDNYYQNISFCEGNCVFQGLDYDSVKITCLCDPSEFLNSVQYKDVNYKDRRNRIKNLTFSTLANIFPENSSYDYIELNRKVMNCKGLIYDLDIAIKNFGNWFALILFLGKVIIFSYFIREKFKPITEEYKKRKEKIENEILTQIPDAKLLNQEDLEKIPKYHIEKIIWSNYAGAFKYDKNKKNKKRFVMQNQEDGEANKFTYNSLLMNKNRVEINQTTLNEDDNKEKKTSSNPPKRLGYVFNDDRQKENDEGHINNRNNVFKNALKDLNYNTQKIKNTNKFFVKEENKTTFINAIYPTSKENLNEINNAEENKSNKKKEEKTSKSKKVKRKMSLINPKKMDQMINDLMPPDYDNVEVNINDKIPPMRNEKLKFNPAKLNQIINEEYDFKKDQKARREFNEDKEIQEVNRQQRNKMEEKNHNREPEKKEGETSLPEKKSGKKKKSIKKKKFGNQNYLEDPDEVARYKKSYLDDDDIGEKYAFQIEPAINYRFCSMTSPEKLFFMKYDYAIDLDRRTFMEIYMGCIKMSQLIMNFIYIPYYHNMKFLKIYFMIFVANFNVFTTTSFYSHYFIGSSYGYKIFMCILNSIFNSFMLFLFSFSKKKFTSVHVLDIWKLKYYKNLYIFIVIASIIFELGFSAFIWFWSSAFCAVYQHSYFFYFLHILESIIITLALPFLFSFLPALLRYFSLIYEKKLLYQINYFVDMFF